MHKSHCIVMVRSGDPSSNSHSRRETIWLFLGQSFTLCLDWEIEKHPSISLHYTHLPSQYENNFILQWIDLGWQEQKRTAKRYKRFFLLNLKKLVLLVSVLYSLSNQKTASHHVQDTVHAKISDFFLRGCNLIVPEGLPFPSLPFSQS